MEQFLEKRIFGARILDVVAAISGCWLALGAFIDARAHTVTPELESFFTEWHLVLYSGASAAGITAFMAIWVHQRNSSNPSEAIKEQSILDKLMNGPAGYGGAFLGALIFAFAGLGDMLWHSLLGIEIGIEALLSPTHLMLGLGAALLMAAPYRSSLRARTGDQIMDWPALVSAALVFSLIVYMSQYAIPLSNDADRIFSASQNQHFKQTAGATKLLIQAFLLVGLLMHLDIHWNLVRGQRLAIMLIHGGLVSILMVDSYWGMSFWTFDTFKLFFPDAMPILFAALTTGICVEAAGKFVRPFGLGPYLGMCAGAWVAAMFAAVYFFTEIDIGWRTQGWIGISISAVIMGWFFGILLNKPVHGESTTL